MQITPRYQRNKIIIFGALLVLALLVAYACVAYYKGLPPFSDRNNIYTESSRRENDINREPATDDQKRAGEKQKESTAPPDVDIEENDTEGNEQAPGSDFAVTLTALNQTGDNVQIRTLINKVSTSGTCTLTLTKGNSVIERQSQVAALPSSSTCKGFDIPLEELSEGDWQVAVTVNISGNISSASKTLTVQ